MVLRSIITVVVALTVGYCALVLMFWLFQERILFQPSAGPYPVTPGDLDLPWREIDLHAEDGARLAAWYVEGPTADAPVVLFLHGNAGHMGYRVERLATFREMGAAAFIIDYRGYGQSEGRPSEAGVHRDAAAAWQWLTTSAGYSPGRIIVYGRSLGTALAARLAAEHDPGALVLESAFTSVPELAGDLYPWLPVRLLARMRFDTAAALAETNAPILLAHSPEDEIIPFEHAQRLRSIRPKATELVRTPGDHNAPTLIAGSPYRAALSRHIERLRASVSE